MSLIKRRIDLKFELADGEPFNAGGDNAFDVSGARASVLIEKTGGVGMTSLSLKVYGLPPSVMNRLTLLGKPLVDNRNNKVTVLAGDDDKGVAVVFAGTIAEAWVDARQAPQVAFIVTGFVGPTLAMKPVAPVSYKGTVDVALVASGIAQQAGYSLENSGVNAQIADPYLAGTALSQLQKLAEAGDFNCLIEDKVIAIWPKGGVRQGEELLISPDTGLVGYPMRTENGIELQTIFNPSVVFGAAIKVESALTPANGQWKVANVTHDLEAETPGGKWFTTMECNILTQETAIVGK